MHARAHRRGERSCPDPVSIRSLSTSGPRSDWATIALPVAAVPSGALSGTLANTGWKAYVGRQLADHTRLVHVPVVGVASMASVNDVINFDPPGTAQPPFVLHPWAVDNNLVPWIRLKYTVAGSQVTHSFITTPGLVQKSVIHQSSAERITRYQQRIPGTPLFSRAYLYQFSNSPVALWDVQLVHSDPSVDLLQFAIDEVVLETFTPHTVDLAAALGASTVSAPLGRYATRTLTSCNLGDGSRPTWTGVSVALPPSDGDSDQALPPSYFSALGGPLVACAGAGVWDNRWLGLRHVPQVPVNTGYQGPPASGSYWDARPLGLAKSPGQTGDQAAFGVTRGGEVVSTGNPTPLGDYVYRLTEHLRPSAYYEQNMTLALKANHPNWVTWSGRTWYDPSVGATQTFGKTLLVGNAQPRPSTQGWLCVDEQHYGHLELAAYYALTGRVFAEQLIREQTQVWLAQRIFHEVGASSSRGLGRTWVDMAAFYWLTGDLSIPAEMLWTHQNRLQGWQAAIAGPVKSYSRMFVTQMVDPVTNQQVESGSAWQLGLLIPGLEAGFYITGDFQILATALDCVGALVQCGWFTNSQNQPACVDYWVFRNGALTTAADYGANGNVPGRSHSSGFFYDWVARATKLGALYLPSPLGPKAAAAVASRYSGVPSTWRQSQWR